MGRVIALVFLVSVSSHAGAVSIYDVFTIKHGVLHDDETWTGKVLLLSDVVVPQENTLTLAAGTWLVFNGADMQNLGQDPARPELIVKGRVVRNGGADSVSIMSINDPRVQDFIQAAMPAAEAVTIAPQNADLTPLKTEWRNYKRRYAILWAVLYSLWLVF